jgi:hypothetical protein
MEYGNLDKMQESWKNFKDLDTCNHNYDYLIPKIAEPQVFIEICNKCFSTKGLIDYV